MKTYDFYAVVYSCDVYCTECVPDGANIEDSEIYPIFADSEWDYAPVCCNCGESHDYVTILENKDSK
jgi:hypothetical protein